jgi:acetaldehyde dehydrogenase
VTGLRVVVVGTGNIGSDLIAKIQRSPFLELAGVAGIDPDSAGLQRARELGAPVTHEGLESLLGLVEGIELAFDATSAAAHPRNAQLLAQHGIVSVDLTPAGLGPAVVPPVNLHDHHDAAELSLVTCGAQATVPIVAAVAQAAKVSYAETISTIASKSAGPGTRQNIDEFTTSTARALETIGGAPAAKAIIILNPADPPILMRNTIYLEVDREEQTVIKTAVDRAVTEVARYVPGYRLTSPPLIADGRATVMVEVEGAGDYLPAYAGNLDIMTSAAVRVGELRAQERA